MHLDHKIPWNTAAYHFNIENSRPDFRHRHTDIYCRNLPSQAKDLNHFAHKLIATIREFSITERAKYPEPIRLNSSSKSQKLFSDELLVYPERRYRLNPYEWGRRTRPTNPLSAEHQNIDHWIEGATAGWNHYDSRAGYGENEDLADAMKMLIVIASLPAEGRSVHEDEEMERFRHEAFSAVLRLSYNPQTPIHELCRLGWGGDVFGFELVVKKAFEVYLLVNVADAVKARERRATMAAAISNRDKDDIMQNNRDISLLETRSFHIWANDALEYDGSKAENVPHAAFWSTCGVTFSWANGTWADRSHYPWVEDANTEVECYRSVRDPLASTDAGGPDVQRQELKQYLKQCFGIMYRYDLWYREWRGKEEAEEMWKTMITQYMYRMWQCAVNEERKEFILRRR